ncbi:MAG: fucose isomerase [Caloramator sp.]|nr:fucose isomerase [Caloramator sp.]
MKHNVKIGVVCLARKTFDYNAAYEIYKQRMEELKKIENVDWCFIEDLVIEIEDAKKAAQIISSFGVDGLVIISGTFHLGHLALILNKEIRKPILLWAFNELPYNGGKIRLNSVCGVNLNASNLYKSGCDNFMCIVSDTIDNKWIDALRMKKSLESAHIGLVGYNAHGFFNLGTEPLSTYKTTGVLVDHYEIVDMYSNEVGKEELEESIENVKKLFDCSGVTEEQVRKVAFLVESAKKFMNNNSLDAIAVRCWPEFAATYGISPCAAMSILQDMGYITACEGDVEAALSMYSIKAAGGDRPFLADLSQVNMEEDYALMWHCGVAPAGLWDGKSVRSLDTYFAGGKGVTADFVMKSGEVTIMRIDSARGKTRVFIEKGQAMPMEKELKGTYAKVRFDKHIKDILNIVTSKGIAHHVAMIYGDYVDVFKKFASLQGFEVIE